jgi:hypothetical protein
MWIRLPALISKPETSTPHQELFNVNYFIVSQTNPQYFEGLNLRDQARTWPCLSYMCHVRSAAALDYLSRRCKLGDIRLWKGDPSTSSCLVSHPRFSQPTLRLLTLTCGCPPLAGAFQRQLLHRLSSPSAFVPADSRTWMCLPALIPDT